MYWFWISIFVLALLKVIAIVFIMLFATGGWRSVSTIPKFIALFTSEITQFADQVRIKLILQLTKVISKSSII